MLRDKEVCKLSKARRSLALALVLVFVLMSSALAADPLTLEGVTIDKDTGLLYLTGLTDFPDKPDLNFTAATEKGDIEVSNAVSLRGEGTSWFVILDYAKNPRGSDLEFHRAENYVLNELAGIVDDRDKGRLISVDSNANIGIEQEADTFRATLREQPFQNDSAYLSATVTKVMEFIANNRADLMTNVAVVIVSSGDVSGANATSIENTLRAYASVTTHIISVAPSARNYGTQSGGWRDQAARFAQKASLTVGGAGYITEELTRDAAKNAVQTVYSAERRKFLVVLNPVKRAYIGQKLTVTQTTSSGKKLTAEGELTEDTYNLWLNSWEVEPDPVPDPLLKPTVVTQTSTYFHSELDESITASSGTTNSSLELIIGIALGVVILALLAVLLIMRSRNGKKAQKKSVNGKIQVQAQASAPKETVVTLRGADGKVLNGTMKNGRLTIGRDPSRGAMLVVAGDGKMSGMHATLAKQGSAMTLTDNGSLNGTKVNGNKISSTVVLQQNDTIAMGSGTYTISWR